MRADRVDLQMVFQDPYASLNPRMTVGAIIDVPPLEERHGRDVACPYAE